MKIKILHVYPTIFSLVEPKCLDMTEDREASILKLTITNNSKETSEEFTCDRSTLLLMHQALSEALSR